MLLVSTGSGREGERRYRKWREREREGKRGRFICVVVILASVRRKKDGQRRQDVWRAR